MRKILIRELCQSEDIVALAASAGAGPEERFLDICGLFFNSQVEPASGTIGLLDPVKASLAM